MSVLPIIEVPDPRLRAISSPVETVDDELRDLIADMFDTMYDAPGIGLAAIQVGVPKRVIVMDLQEEEDEEGSSVRAPRVFINPEILDPADELSTYTEGCLSVPDQYAEVDRPARCRVEVARREGGPRTTRPSRAFSPPASSTRWIISRGSSSSTISRASSAT